jgi:hypothetical protein
VSETDEILNRPGQPTLAYRITDQAGSRRRMLSRLQSYTVPSGPHQGTQPLAQLTTRAATDPAVALLDACAAVFDVLSFYQERLANEGFLRTATEDRSIYELTRSLGYRAAPALAASTYLAFCTDENPDLPQAVTVPGGTRVKSVPGQDERSQTFETAGDFTARRSANQLRPLERQPQTLLASDDPTSGPTISTLRLAGVTSRLRAGDLLLFASVTTVRVLQVVLLLAERCTEVRFAVLDGPALRLPASAIAGAPQVVIAYRQQVAFFGGNALPYASLPKPDPTYYRGTDLYADPTSSWDDSSGNNRRTIWLDSWGRLQSGQTSSCDVYLEHSVFGIVPGSSILLCGPRGVSQRTVTGTVETTVRGYGTTVRTTGLKLSPAPTTVSEAAADRFLTRDTTAYVQSEPLPLCPMVPLSNPAPLIDQVTVDSQVVGLLPGQPVLVRGEPVDAPGTTECEIAFLSQATLDSGYTTLSFRTPLSRAYQRQTVTLSANVVAATHGETVDREILGSGDGSQQNQRFVLKRAPLTYLPAATGTGSISTLEVRVNGVLWREVSSLLEQGPHSPCYVLQLDELGQASVLFGDGVHGARLPSGENNVVGRYRFGSGPEGQVRSGSLQLLLNRPLGLRSVANPQAASGGTPKETAAQWRENAPLSARTLGRAVSLSDYEALAGAFPNIAKAQAVAGSLGGAAWIQLTVATQDGTPLLAASALYQSLLAALLALGNPTQALSLCDYRPRPFRLHAQLAIDPNWLWAEVKERIVAALQQSFGFAQRSFGQPVRASDLIYVIQNVEGVIGVTLAALYLADTPTANSTLLVAAPAILDPLGQSVGAELLVLALGDDDLEISP